jgi:multidrug resistance protein, MATE family
MPRCRDGRVGRIGILGLGESYTKKDMSLSGKLSEDDHDVEKAQNLPHPISKSKRFDDKTDKLSVILSRMPCNDVLDERILRIALPAIMNFAILPLVGAVDTAFVGRMDNALALAGQGAANQVFSSTFWIISFLPNVITPLIAQAIGSDDYDKLEERVGQSIFLALLLGMIGSLLLINVPHKVLGLVLSDTAPAYEYAKPYLSIRAMTFIPAIISTVSFACLRATMDLLTPLKISLFANLVNIILDPFFIFNKQMGVAGAALATCISDVVGCILYTSALYRKKMIRDFSKIFRFPSLEAIKPILMGGLGVQMRAVALNIAFLGVTRATQAIDVSGTAAAAHSVTISLWQLGGTVLLAWSSVASIIIPNELAKAKRENKTGMASIANAKFAAERLLSWGLVLGVVFSILQIACLPLLTVFTKNKAVQQAAVIPSIIGALLQIINGVVFIGEGICQGTQSFNYLAKSTFFATAGMLTSLKYFGKSLIGVWGSFAVFNGIRLLAVLRHHFVEGPFGSKNKKILMKIDQDEQTVAVL